MVPCQTSSLLCVRAHLWLSHEQHKIARVSIAERESNDSSTHWLLFPICQLVKMRGQYKSIMWPQPVLLTLTWFFFSSGLFCCTEELKLFWILRILKQSGVSSTGELFSTDNAGHIEFFHESGVCSYIYVLHKSMSYLRIFAACSIAEWKINYIMLATPSKYWWSLLFLVYPTVTIASSDQIEG